MRHLQGQIHVFELLLGDEFRLIVAESLGESLDTPSGGGEY
jgi:hypothetical protein